MFPSGRLSVDTQPGGARRVRVLLCALLVALTALWSYGSFLTGRDAVDLIRLRTLDKSLGQPTDSLILALQAERRLTTTVLGGDVRSRPALDAQRVSTDKTVATLRRFVTEHDLRLIGAGAVRQRAAQLVTRLDSIEPTRQAVDGGRIERVAAAARYTAIIDAGFDVYGVPWASGDLEMVAETRDLVALTRAREILAREDALVAGVLAARRMSDNEHRRLVDLVAAQRFVRTEAAVTLPDTARSHYAQVAAGPEFAKLRSLESLLIAAGATGQPAVEAGAWQAAVEPVLSRLRQVVADAVQASIERNLLPATVGVATRFGLVGGLGLAVVVASIIGSIGTLRRANRRLAELRTSAVALAEEEFPRIAERLRRGEPIDALMGPSDRRPATQPADPLDAIDQAMAAVRREAIRTLAEREETHQRSVRLFRQLTQRNQRLLRQQLTLLDTMERQDRTAEELADLFRIDHLTNRVRRNVETLITLSGGTPARRWRRPVPLLDVIRGAVAEVDDYPRVLVSPVWAGALAGPAVTDMIHLFAELIENALAASPASSMVRVTGNLRIGDRAVFIDNDGPGLGHTALAAANSLLRKPRESQPPDTKRGLYIVGRLARRHGVQVELRAGAHGGTTAVVLIPVALMVPVSGARPATAPNAMTTELSEAPTRSRQVGRPDEPGPARRPHSLGRPGRPDLPVRARHPGTAPSPRGGVAMGQPVRAGRPEPDGSETMEIPAMRPAAGPRGADRVR